MKKIIYIMGKSASGKDTIYKELIRILDVDTYLMYTTRPIRKGEVNGETYHFISYEDMQEYKIEPKNVDLIEVRSYNTVHGIWEYATIKDVQLKGKKDLLMMGTLESYEKVKKFFMQDSLKSEYKIIPVYVEIDDGIRLQRALKREQMQENPKYKEMCRRFLSDEQDFSEDKLLKNNITKRFKNDDISQCIEEIIEYIKK
ncbi:MAG: guanylate kinase [Clostridia bacterium]|nr:guanylate kinase [Clostridia bacterium]